MRSYSSMPTVNINDIPRTKQSEFSANWVNWRFVLISYSYCHTRKQWTKVSDTKKKKKKKKKRHKILRIMANHQPLLVTLCGAFASAISRTKINTCSGLNGTSVWTWLCCPGEKGMMVWEGIKIYLLRSWSWCLAFPGPMWKERGRVPYTCRMHGL